MYTCRPTLRTLNLLLHSFVLWVIQRALKRRASSRCQFLNLYGSTCRIMPSGGTRMKGESEKLGETHFVRWKNRHSAAAITFIARGPLLASSTETLLDGAVDQGVGQDNWPLPEKRLSENNANRRRRKGRQRRRRKVSIKQTPLGSWWR